MIQANNYILFFKAVLKENITISVESLECYNKCIANMILRTYK